jgi:myo-inositol-1(or 4)-monophosphatase
MNLQELTLQVCDLTRETGNFLHQEMGTLNSSDIRKKGVHDYVTRVDKESERRIMKQLSVMLPGSGFIAEESPGLLPAEMTWIIDPLDGTTNFIHGVPLYCISIALMRGKETLMGVVYEVNHQECFYTWHKAPSYLNGQEIKVSETPVVDQSLFATGFPFYDYSRLDDYLAVFRHLLQHSVGARRLGTAAADLAYVACGRFDGFFEYGLSPWDVAGGAILVKNAGGQVSDFRGGGDYLFGKEIIATNTLIYKEFKKLFSAWNHAGF